MRVKSFIAVLIVLMIAINFYYSFDRSQKPVAQRGVLDLTSWNFEKDGPVLLNGEWEIYLNQFLNPEDFNNGFVKPVYIRFPATKKEFETLDPVIKKTYATFRLRVKINDSYKEFGLKSFIFLSSYKIFVNNDLKIEIGKVGASQEDSVPYYMNSQVYFQKDCNEIEIIYHASDFHLNDLSIRSPLFGINTQIEKQTSYNLGKDMFLAGSLFIMGIYHLGLFAKRRRDKASLYFGLLCVLIALRTLVTGERVLEQMVFLPFEVYCKMGYISAFIGLPMFINFLNNTIDNLLSDKVVKTTNYVGIALTLVTLLLQRRFYYVFLNPFFAYLSAILIYCLIKLLLAYHRKTSYVGIVLIGFFAIGITVINDMIYQNSLTSVGSMIPIGVFLFTFTQSYLLASRFANAYNEAETLTIEKENILLELKELNKNLERKVEERTKDLQKSMEQLAIEVEEHKRAEEQISAAYDKIELMSKTDYLTKLSNRRDIFDRMQKEQHTKSTLYSVILCDIDHFKNVNDTYGHRMGDKVLLKVAEVLKHSVSADDMVGRWGGEEFLLLLKNTEGHKAYKIMEQIRKTIENTNISENSININVTLTFGICQFDFTSTFENCIAKADKALYKGKNSGRNKVVLSE